MLKIPTQIYYYIQEPSQYTSSHIYYLIITSLIRFGATNHRLWDGSDTVTIFIRIDLHFKPEYSIILFISMAYSSILHLVSAILFEHSISAQPLLTHATFWLISELCICFGIAGTFCYRNVKSNTITKRLTIFSSHHQVVISFQLMSPEHISFRSILNPPPPLPQLWSRNWHVSYTII